MPSDGSDRPDKRNAREIAYDRFVGLLARHDSRLRRFIRSILPIADAIDDVMQETALECWNKFDSFQPSQPSEEDAEFVRWASVIARFKVMSWQRDHARDRLVFRETVIEKLAAEIDLSNERIDELRSVQKCLDKLETSDRTLVLAIHSPNDSVQKIAERTGQHAKRLYRRVGVLRSLLLDCVRQNFMNEVARG